MEDGKLRREGRIEGFGFGMILGGVWGGGRGNGDLFDVTVLRVLWVGNIYTKLGIQDGGFFLRLFLG